MNVCQLIAAAGSADFLQSAPPSRLTIIFQFILTLGLLAVGLYSIALRRKIAVLGNLALLVTVAAMVLVWWPMLATRVAQGLGIGRGVDLILYCWVVISVLMILNLHLKMRIQAEMVTELIRRLAIAQPFAVLKRNEAAKSPEIQSADRPNPDGR